jgi:hypothetical protein
MVKVGGTRMGGSLIAKNTYYYSLSSILICILFFSFVTIVRGDDVTTIGFSPSQKIVQFDSDFSIDVICTPTQPIKAYEFQLQFDPSYLEAISVSEGDIFDGYPTFFNQGVIDNDEGVINNLFGLIVGPGNVSDSGRLVSVTFHAKSNAGLSTLSLVNPGVTNELGYISIEKQDGTITIYNPDNPHGVSPINPANKSQNVALSLSELSVEIYDFKGASFDWMIYTSPDIGSNSGTNSFNGTKTCNISGLTYSTTYTWYVHCKDIVSEKWTNRSFWFRTVDKGSGTPGGGNGGDNGGGPTSDQDIVIKENNQPDQPMKPTGSTSIEVGVVYSYSSYAMDIDGDLVRLKFDWGDKNYSDWSDYILSNTTVEMNHYWNIISNYDVRVIAQDEQGENSSWSEPLEVLVSQIDAPDVGLPIVDIFDIVQSVNISGATYFLVDLDNDGKIDIFYNPVTGFNSSVSYLDDNTILIDLDGIDSWDYKYNFEQKILSSYPLIPEDSSSQISSTYPWFLLLIPLFILIGLMLLFRNKINLFILKLRLSILRSKSSPSSHTKRSSVWADSLSSKHKHHIHFFSNSEDKKLHDHKEFKKLDKDKRLNTKLYNLKEEKPFDESFNASDVDVDYIDSYSRMTSHLLSSLSKKIEDDCLLHELIRSKIDLLPDLNEEQLSISRISDIEKEVDRLFIDNLYFDRKVSLD